MGVSRAKSNPTTNKIFFIYTGLVEVIRTRFRPKVRISYLKQIKKEALWPAGFIIPQSGGRKKGNSEEMAA
jgi:hypothetical protein